MTGASSAEKTEQEAQARQIAARHPLVRQFFASTEPAWLWDKGGEVVLWANDAGCAFFKAESLYDMVSRRFRRVSPATGQIARLARMGELDETIDGQLRFFLGMRSITLSAELTPVELSDGKQAVFVRETGENTDSQSARITLESAKEVAASLASETSPTALITGSGDVLSQSETFGALGVTSEIVANIMPRLIEGETVVEGNKSDNISLSLIPIGRDDEQNELYVLTAGANAEVDQQTLVETAQPATNTDETSPENLIETALEVREEPDETAATSNVDEEASQEEETTLVAFDDNESSDVEEVMKSEEEETSFEGPDVTSTDDAASTSPIDDTAQNLPFVFERKPRSTRFLWELDAEGKLSSLSPEFVEAMGPAHGELIGTSLPEIGEQLGLEPEVSFQDHFRSRSIWSEQVDWPIEGIHDGLALCAPVSLTAMPIFARDRTFEGYRGFGSIETADAVPASFSNLEVDETMPANSPEDEEVDIEEWLEAITPDEVDAEDTDRSIAETSAEETTETSEETGKVIAASFNRSDEDNKDAGKVVPLHTKPRAVEQEDEAASNLSRPEQQAFEKIAEALGAKIEDAGSSEDEVKDSAESAETPTEEVDQSNTASSEELSNAEAEAPLSAELTPDTHDVAEVTSPSEEVADVDDVASSEQNEIEELLDFDAADFIERQSRRHTPQLAFNQDVFSERDDAEAAEDDAEQDENAAPDAIADEPTGEEAEIEETADAVEEKTVSVDHGDDDTTTQQNVAQDQNDEVDEDDEIDLPAAALPAVSAIASNQVASEQALKSVLDKLPIGVLVSHERDVLYSNPALLSLLGYPDRESLNMAGGMDTLFVGGGPGIALEHKSNASLRTADGGTVKARAKIQSIKWGDVSGVLTSIFAEEQQKQSSSTQLGGTSDILDIASDGLLILNSKGKVSYGNASACALFGREPFALKGQHITALFADESKKKVSDYLDGLLSNGVASVLNDGREVIGLEAKGGFLPLFMTIGRIEPDPETGSERFCAVLRDITQWKRAEEELIAARSVAEEASAQKSDFLAKISHEIRTPLNAIIGFSEVMMEERFGPLNNDRYRDYARDIHLSGSHVMSLVNDLLDLSKIEAGELDLSFEAVKLNNIIQECAALMQPNANRDRVIIRTSFDSDLPHVVADERSIRQVVLNLLSNAVKFTRAGGQVIISTMQEEDGEVTIRVRDTGIGMNELELERAMKPFRQVNPKESGEAARPTQKGTGLGLPLTKALVEANRARFEIESKPDHGTLIQVVFPNARVLME